MITDTPISGTKAESVIAEALSLSATQKKFWECIKRKHQFLAVYLKGKISLFSLLRQQQTLFVLFVEYELYLLPRWDIFARFNDITRLCWIWVLLSAQVWQGSSSAFKDS